jgi:Arc/MetJ-type ribon-helix-helix transcriptional regulator
MCLPTRKTRIAPDKTFLSVKLPIRVREWVRAEAEALAVTSSDVVRGALHLLQAQPADVRREVIRDAERESESPAGRVAAPR